MCFLYGALGGIVGMSAVFTFIVVRDAIVVRIRTTPNIIRIIQSHGGSIPAQELYRSVNGDTQAIDRLIKIGIIAPDQVPPRNFLLTVEGEKQFVMTAAQP